MFHGCAEPPSFLLITPSWTSLDACLSSEAAILLSGTLIRVL